MTRNNAIRVSMLITVLLLAILLLSSCNSAPNDPNGLGNDASPTQSEESLNILSQEADKPAGLVLNEYPGLEIIAEIMDENAILPGSSIPVAVMIKNNGEKTISYMHGSGSFETPEALSIAAAGLQLVIPEDRLGAATMELEMAQLAPGEELQFIIYLKALSAHTNFDNYTYELYNGGGIYIANVTWKELQQQFPELSGAASDDYNGQAYFQYYIVSEDEGANATYEPTGYAEAAFQLSVSTDMEETGLPQQETESSPPIAGEPFPGGMIANADLATALLDDINTKRAAEGNNALVVDGTLEEVAFSYAKELYMGGYTFRNATKFHTLPSGKQVYSLFANSGYKGTVDDFGYSVWYNSNGNGDKGLKVLDNYMKGTNLYQTRAIQGDYTKVGIACATSTDNSDPYTVIILMCLKD